MTNSFNFRFQLSVAQIIEAATNILEIKGVDVACLTNISNDRGSLELNSIIFSYNNKTFTLVVYSANAIALSFYCPKADYAGSRNFGSIESCFNALNSLVELEVKEEATEKEITRTVLISKKYWVKPTVTSPEVKTGKQKLQDADNTYSFDEDELPIAASSYPVVGKIDLSSMPKRAL